PEAARAAEHGVGAERRPLPNERLVADDRALADPGACEDDRFRADDRAVLENRRTEVLPAGARAVGEPGSASEDRAILDAAARAEDDRLVDDHVLAEGRPAHRRRRLSTSSGRASAIPSRTRRWRRASCSRCSGST